VTQRKEQKRANPKERGKYNLYPGEPNKGGEKPESLPKEYPYRKREEGP